MDIMDNMRVTCKHCGRAHPSYECKYRDTKSTAARKDVLISGERSQPGYAGDGSVIERPSREAESAGLIPAPSRINAVAAKAEQVKRGVVPTPISHTAGTQALPVDTNPESTKETLDSSIHGTPFTPSAGTGEDKDRQPNHSGVLKLVDSTGRCISAEIEGSNPSPTTKTRGRPRIHPDRKAYKAAHERERRARMKAAK